MFMMAAAPVFLSPLVEAPLLPTSGRSWWWPLGGPRRRWERERFDYGVSPGGCTRDRHARRTFLYFLRRNAAVIAQCIIVGIVIADVRFDIIITLAGRVPMAVGGHRVCRSWKLRPRH